MMHMISLEFLMKHTSINVEVAQIPRIGEWISYGEDTLEVKGVIHICNPDADNEPVAIVRVK